MPGFLVKFPFAGRPSSNSTTSPVVYKVRCIFSAILPVRRCGSRGTTRRALTTDPRITSFLSNHVFDFGCAPIAREKGWLASITNNAAGLDVKADVADGQPRLVAETGDESQEAPDVIKICSQSDGSADGAGALVSALLHQSDETEQVDFAAHGETGAHVFFGQAFRDLSCAGIAE